MPRMLSQDLRERVIAALDAGCRAVPCRGSAVLGLRSKRNPLASVGRSEWYAGCEAAGW